MADPQPPRPAGDRDNSRRPIESRLTWLGLLGGALLLALLGLVLVQAREVTLLRSLLRADEVSAALHAAEAEARYLRLREQWHLASAEPAEPTLAAVRQGYGAWQDQLAVLHALPASALAANDQALQAQLAQLDSFKLQADRVLDDQTHGADRNGLAALQATLDALAGPQHAVVAAAKQWQTEQTQQSARRLRSHTRLGLATTIVAVLLTLSFAALALRQVHALRQRRSVLEELADKLRLSRREAEVASQAKSAFLANMSHEIRTPFHGLMGMLSLLRESGLSPKQIDHLRAATESADHLLALLNDILDMSQLESGRLSLAPAPTTLRVLLRDIEALLRPQASAKSLALHLDADPAVPERAVLDATRVRQIVANLLSNAIKFSDAGAVMLDVRCLPGHAAEGAAARLAFVVTDSGIGMDEATQARLFNRFMQADSSRSRRHGGSGLGLEISRRLARLMGGDIIVRSKPGEGSCFTFWLPLRAAPAAEVPLAAAVAAGGNRGPLRVLVADDHPINREYIAVLLESLGHEARFTTNGEEALAAALEQRFDLVLMDLHMPVLDGIAATQAIRALPDPSRSTVPIVALTADGLPETRDRCVVAGMNDFLTKPVNPQSLATCLRRLFGTAGPAPAAAPLPDGGVTGGARAAAADDASLVDGAALALSLQAIPMSKLAALIQAFLDQGPQTVQRLRAAVRDAQPLDLRVHAHAAKGAALNLGLIGLAHTAQALQDGAAHLPAHEIAHLVQRFEAQLPATQLAVQTLLAQRAGAPGDQTMMGSGSSRMPKRP